MLIRAVSSAVHVLLCLVNVDRGARKRDTFTDRGNAILGNMSEGSGALNDGGWRMRRAGDRTGKSYRCASELRVT